MADWNDRSAAHFSERRFAEALEAADTALLIDRRNASALNNRANALFRLDRSAEAVAVHERIHEIAPIFLPSWVNRAAILSLLGRKPEALRAAQVAAEIARDDRTSPFLAQAHKTIADLQAEGVRSAPDTVHSLLASAYDALVRRRGDQAIALFGRTIAAAPTIPAAWEWKATALREMKRFDEALECVDAGLRHVGDDSDLHHERGLVLKELRRPADAVTAFEAAIRADPLDPAPWSDRGKTLAALGRFEEALDSLTRATELVPDHPAPWQSRGMVEEQLGRLDEAARSFTEFLKYATPDMRLQVQHAHSRIPVLEAQARALRGEAVAAPVAPSVEAVVVIPEAVVPDAPAALAYPDAMKQAEALVSQGQAERALEFYDQALVGDAGSYGPWAGKAEAFYALKRYADAVGHLDKALALNPSFAGGWQRRARALGALRMHAEALASWRKAQALAPDSLLVWNGVGLSLFALRRYDEALGAFEKALAIDPRHAIARFNKAEVELRLDRGPDAARSFQQFLSLAPPHLTKQIAEARRQLQGLSAE